MSSRRYTLQNVYMHDRKAANGIENTCSMLQWIHQEINSWPSLLRSVCTQSFTNVKGREILKKKSTWKKMHLIS